MAGSLRTVKNFICSFVNLLTDDNNKAFNTLCMMIFVDAKVAEEEKNCRADEKTCGLKSNRLSAISPDGRTYRQSSL